MLVKKTTQKLKDNSYAIGSSCFLINPGPRSSSRIIGWDDSEVFVWVLRMLFCLRAFPGQPTRKNLRVWEEEPGQSYCKKWRGGRRCRGVCWTGSLDFLEK